MAPRYMSPHMRNRMVGNDADTSISNQDTGDLKLALRRLSDLRISRESDRPLHTMQELNHHYGGSVTQSTLRDTATKLNELGFVVLFRNANPRWKTDGIIFAHTNIRILPGYNKFKDDLETNRTSSDADMIRSEAEAEAVIKQDFEQSKKLEVIITHEKNKDQQLVTETTAANRIQASRSLESNKGDKSAIPIFTQVARSQTGRSFVFHGYFHLSRLDFIKPHSRKLVHMLRQKWEMPPQPSHGPPTRTRQRDPEAWAGSLKEEWAVLQFVGVPAEHVPAEPVIQVLPEEQPTTIGTK